jgi:cell division septum initiation protein DivIVA
MFTDREFQLLLLRMSQMIEPLAQEVEELQEKVEELSNAIEKRPKAGTRGRKRVQQAEENPQPSH